jgi:hypothetical protein
MYPKNGLEPQFPAEVEHFLVDVTLF